jgi:hypothetical protein
MATRHKSNPGKVLVMLNGLIAGLTNSPPQGQPTLMIDGVSYAVADLLTKLGGYQKLYVAAEKAEADRTIAVQAREAIDADATKLAQGTRSALKAMFGKTSPALESFDIQPNRQPPPLTNEQEAAKIAKAKATRAARAPRASGRRRRSRARSRPPPPSRRPPPHRTGRRNPGRRRPSPSRDRRLPESRADRCHDSLRGTHWSPGGGEHTLGARKVQRARTPPPCRATSARESPSFHACSSGARGGARHMLPYGKKNRPIYPTAARVRAKTGCGLVPFDFPSLGLRRGSKDLVGGEATWR